MILHNSFRELLEQQEFTTVSDAFGGPSLGPRAPAFRITPVQQWLLSQSFEPNAGVLDAVLCSAKATLPPSLLPLVVKNCMRFAFLIELTNLTVKSTKMKTRWLPGQIMMPQPGSFIHVRGQFEPGNDPRAATFETCVGIFQNCLTEIVQRYREDPRLGEALTSLSRNSSVPYEFVFDYIDAFAVPVHVPGNIKWAFNDDSSWLIRARPIMRGALAESLVTKIQTKAYKTDRSLTGKDQTNRAKRWEVLAGDFQHASLAQCWSVERRLLEDLACFDGFPLAVRAQLEAEDLLNDEVSPTRCPVTLDVLTYDRFGEDLVHGRAEYQVGHLHPLKRGGFHQGENVRWQSADGNRIQGDLSIEQTAELLEGIAQRRSAYFRNDFVQYARTGTD